jgi:hypothetical protein
LWTRRKQNEKARRRDRQRCCGGRGRRQQPRSGGSPVGTSYATVHVCSGSRGHMCRGPEPAVDLPGSAT